MVDDDYNGGCYPCTQLPTNSSGGEGGNGVPGIDLDSVLGTENNKSPDYKPCDWLGVNVGFCSVPATVLDGATITLDFLALFISTVEAGVADTVWIGAVGISIFFPVAAPELLAGALELDMEIAGSLGFIENPMGLYSSGFTAVSDFLKGNTYPSNDGVYVGGNTIASITTTAIGFLPESNIDLAASAYIFGVDIGDIDMPTSINVSKPVQGLLTSLFSK